MTSWKAVTSVLASALLALGPALPATADSIGTRVAPDGDELLRLEVDTITPRVVTVGSPEVTVTGRIRNIGDRRVEDIQVRIQRGDPVGTDDELRELAAQGTDAASTPFVDVAGSLAPGESTPVTVTATTQALEIGRPGVYPLLVNVNGEPDYGGQARLAAVSLPLPVLSLSGGQGATAKPVPPGITMLWPLLDTHPRRIPAADGRVVLADDQLADSISPGGRLFGLVNSAASASSNGALMSSLCFAVDPDLLSTVAAMAEGYQVREETGRLVPGRGSAVATDWLTRVAELTRGRCVLSVPFADADLVALSRSGTVDLTHLALSSSIVAEILAPVQPEKEVFWPVAGTLDQRTLMDLATLGPATVIADPGHLRKVAGQPPYTIGGLNAANPVRALPIDTLVSSSLNPSPGDNSLQRGLAALAFRALFDGRSGGQVLITPPRRWTASSAELRGYLALAEQLFDAGYAAPRPLQHSLSAPNQGTAGGLTYTPQDAAREIPPAVTTDVVRINRTKRDLLSAMGDDGTSDVAPNSLLDPIQYGLLRATSTAWRGRRVDRAVTTVEQVDEQLDALCDKVVINHPGRPLALASGDSPIPVSVSNGLPVSILVRIRLDSQPGLRPEQPPAVIIPPHHSISRYIPVEVTRAGRFTVDATLATPGGTKLGSTTRLELSSTSYGIITIAITGTAGGVLVLLVAIRIFRRVRAARAGAPGQEPIVRNGAHGDP